MLLLQKSEVQSDLNLTAEQRRAIERVKIVLDAAFQPRFDEVQYAGHRSFPTFQKLVVEYWQEADERVVQPLDAPQRKRLRAIQYQSIGFRALLLPDLREALALRGDQLDAIAKLTEEVSNRRSTWAKVHLLPSGRESEDKTTLQDIEREFDLRALAVLTASQAAQYRRILGVHIPAVETSAPWVNAVAVD